MLGKTQPSIDKRAGSQIRTAGNDDPRRLTAGVAVDDVDPLAAADHLHGYRLGLMWTGGQFCNDSSFAHQPLNLVHLAGRPAVRFSIPASVTSTVSSTRMYNSPRARPVHEGTPAECGSMWNILTLRTRQYSCSSLVRSESRGSFYSRYRYRLGEIAQITFVAREISRNWPGSTDGCDHDSARQLFRPRPVPRGRIEVGAGGSCRGSALAPTFPWSTGTGGRIFRPKNLATPKRTSGWAICFAGELMKVKIFPSQTFIGE